MLHDAMVSVGFSNCRDEWWHYSYGDAGWAVRVGEQHCFYGKVDLEKVHYEHLEELSREAMKSRTNPFL